MLHRRSVLLAGPALLLARGRVQAQSMQAQSMPEQNLAAILKERVDIARDTMGLVAATIDSGQRSVTVYGQSGSDRPLDADTVFEIGSITKVLTSLLLADMVLRGEVAMDDPASKFLPASVRMPDFEGAPITLLDLATYTSGLPRMPSNFAPKDPANPYIDYTAERLYDYLSNHKLGFKPGKHFEYSNLGFGLLGHILELRAGRSYEELVVSRICAPLGMDDTRITLTEFDETAAGAGPQRWPRAGPELGFLALAGAGAFHSTANDLLKFLQMCLDPADTPVAAALKMTLAERRPRMDQRDVGLGWFVSSRFGDELIWKSGGTGGYATFIGYSTETSETASCSPMRPTMTLNIALGTHLVNAAYPPPKLRREVQVDPAVLATYAGRYEISPTFILTVRPDGARLFIQATAQPEFEAYAESETEFFYRVVDAQVSFARPEGGMAPSLTLHQNGKNMPGKRLP